MVVVSADERRIERWLDWLRDGSDEDKVAARRGLAGVFEERGMLAEAIELLESNVEAGVRGAETLRWLSRLYQAQGDEASSLEAAVNASQNQEVSPMSEPPGVVEMPAEPRAIRRLMPYFLMIVGLGITVGVVLWTLTPSLKP
jgi:hypothetical protein